MRARRRMRNRYAALTSAALVGLAMLCTVMLVTGFGSIDVSAKAKKAKPKAQSTTRLAETTTLPPTTTTSTSTTTTTTPPTTVPPATLPNAAPTTVTTVTTITTTTTLSLPDITASVSHTPTFCKVTLALSTGPTQQYPLDAFVRNVGDVYVFVAAFGGYRVDVRAEVVSENNAPTCQIGLAHLARI